MKKTMSFTAILLLSILVVACGNGNENEGEAGKEANGKVDVASNVSFAEIVTEIKEQIAADYAATGYEDALVDGKLMSHLEVDLTGSVAEDPSIEIWLENMGINQEILANGTVIAAMMNVNSDEMIVLEAKDGKDVDALKESLEKELASQNQTWEQYLPDQHEKVKNNVIKTNGKFLLYVTYDYPEKIVALFDAKFK